jgi:hypothetical protein
MAPLYFIFCNQCGCIIRITIEHVNLGNQPLYILYAYCFLLNFFSSFFYFKSACRIAAERRKIGWVSGQGGI